MADTFPRSNWSKFDAFGVVLIALAFAGLFILALEDPFDLEPDAPAAPRAHHTARRRPNSLDKDVTPR